MSIPIPVPAAAAQSTPEMPDAAHPTCHGGTVGIEIAHKVFGTGSQPLLALRDVRLIIDPGEFVCIVGGSGCGKTTLLRIIAGLETDFAGTVSLDGHRITGPSLERGVVFQEHRLLPWLTVRDNVAFGKTGKHKDFSPGVSHYLDLVGLSDFTDAYPHQLSGGMSQRVAIARALAGRPEVLLLDEPFASLDALTRTRMQEELLSIWQVERTTVVLVTHDIEEAVFLADRIIIMSAQPGTVRRIVNVDLARPRERTGRAFSEVRKTVFDEFVAPAATWTAAPERLE
jgi:sulfonate transport system ATP-binding protein